LFRVEVVGLPSGFQIVHVSPHDLDPGAGQLLEMRGRANVIYVRVTEQRNANVFGLVAEFADRGFDQRRGWGYRTMKQDVAGRRSDHIDTEPARAHIVNVPDDVYRLRRFEPQ
jgi:hypothetical protein